MKSTVLVLQEQVPPYRVPFFRFVAEELSNRDLDLCVVSSSALPKVDELGFWYCHIAHDLHQLRLRLDSSRAMDESSCSGEWDWLDATARCRSVIAALRGKLSDA
jgi:hypothetical protein